MMHRANDGATVYLPCQPRQLIAELDAGDSGGDGLKLAADFHGGRRLHVPHVEMTRPAVEKDEDAMIRRCRVPLRRVPIRMHELRQRQPEHRAAADLQHAATREARTRTGRQLSHLEILFHFFFTSGCNTTSRTSAEKPVSRF